jgi:hypothetical protein
VDAKARCSRHPREVRGCAIGKVSPTLSVSYVADAFTSPRTGTDDL